MSRKFIQYGDGDLKDYSLIDYFSDKVRDVPDFAMDKKPYVNYNLRGQISSAEKHLLYKICQSLKSGVCANVGVFTGTSTAAMCWGIHDGNKKGKVFASDLYGKYGEYNLDKTIPNLEQYIISNNLNIQLIPIVGNSREMGFTIKEPIEFIFIDGNHSYRGCKGDFEAWARLIPNNGYLAFHDVHCEGVYKTIEELDSSWKFIRQIFSTKLFQKI